MTTGLNETKPADNLAISPGEISIVEYQNARGAKNRTVFELTPGKVYSVWAVETDHEVTDDEYAALEETLKNLGISKLESLFVVEPQDIPEHVADLHVRAHMRYRKLPEQIVPEETVSPDNAQ